MKMAGVLNATVAVLAFRGISTGIRWKVDGAEHRYYWVKKVVTVSS